MYVALALGGVAVTGTAVVVALTRVHFAVPSLHEISVACERVVFPHLRPTSVLVLLLGSAGLAAMALTVRAALRQIVAGRRFEQELVVAGRLQGVPRGYVIADATPQAFCVGMLRPRVYVSEGALELLDEDEREAVLVHEAHHARRRDPLRLLVARSLAEGLFFLPVVRRVAGRYAALAELAADDAAVRAGRGPRALASALLAFDGHPSPAVVGIAPERVDHLLGQRARWELSALLVLGGVVTLAVLAAVTVRLAEATPPAAMELSMLLAQACMLAMAVAPLVLGAAAVLGGRRLVRGR